MNYQALYQEITTDPAGLGYAGKTNAEKAALLNALTQTQERSIIDAYEIIDATVPLEWAALSAAEKQRYQTITGAGRVNIRSANTRSSLAAIFGVLTQTRTNLLALQNQSVSRATVLGLGPVAAIDIAEALRLYA